jgi:CBS domain-containing protein
MRSHPVRTIGELLAGRSVEHLGPSATAREATRLMAERRVGAIAVMDGQLLAGIFTERDLMARVVAAGRDPDTTTLSEVMTTPPQTIEAQRSLVDGLSVMFSNRYRHLPVIDNGEVVGMLSCRDVPTEYLLLYENWVESVGPAKAGALTAG